MQLPFIKWVNDQPGAKLFYKISFGQNWPQKTTLEARQGLLEVFIVEVKFWWKQNLLLEIRTEDELKFVFVFVIYLQYSYPKLSPVVFCSFKRMLHWKESNYAFLTYFNNIIESFETQPFLLDDFTKRMTVSEVLYCRNIWSRLYEAC